MTFRAIHWTNFNSTALIGDSNFGQIQFGDGKGKVGASTPGVRLWAPTIKEIDPLCSSSYRNTVLMVGTNDLKNNIPDKQVYDLYHSYKTKVALIRKFNPKARIFVCPVLPTRVHEINRRINIFNNLILDDLVQSNLNVVFVRDFIDFLDKSTNLLNTRLSKGDDLHLNKRGVGLLVKLLKNSIFRNRNRNLVHSPRLYSNALRGGPPATRPAG